MGYGKTVVLRYAGVPSQFQKEFGREMCGERESASKAENTVYVLAKKCTHRHHNARNRQEGENRKYEG